MDFPRSGATDMRRKDERLSADVGALLAWHVSRSFTSTKYSLGGEILRGCVGAVIGKFQGGKLNSHSQVFRPLPRLDRCSQWNSFLLLIFIGK